MFRSDSAKNTKKRKTEKSCEQHNQGLSMKIDPNYLRYQSNAEPNDRYNKKNLKEVYEPLLNCDLEEQLLKDQRESE